MEDVFVAFFVSGCFTFGDFYGLDGEDFVEFESFSWWGFVFLEFLGCFCGDGYLFCWRCLLGLLLGCLWFLGCFVGGFYLSEVD